MTGLGSRVESLSSDAVRNDSTDDLYPSYPQSRPSDSLHARGQLSVGRQQEMANSSASVSPGLLHPTPSPGSLIPSPKRRRLEAMDAHCDSLSAGDQHGKAVLPVICLHEETDPMPTTLVNSAAARGGVLDSGERADKLSPSPGVADKVSDPHERRDSAKCCPKNDEKLFPVDRKSPPNDS